MHMYEIISSVSEMCKGAGGISLGELITEKSRS